MNRLLELFDLLNNKTFSPEMAMLMEAAVVARLNILVTGLAQSGKSTLLGILANFVHGRVVTIGCPFEEKEKRNLFYPWRRIEAISSTNPSQTGNGHSQPREEVPSIFQMFKQQCCLIVDECQMNEAIPLLNHARTGPAQVLMSLSALHPQESLAQLESLVLGAGGYPPERSIRRDIASAFPLVIHTESLSKEQKKVTHMGEFTEISSNEFAFKDIILYEITSRDPVGGVHGRFIATGVTPRFLDGIKVAGIKLPDQLFKSRVLLKD